MRELIKGDLMAGWVDPKTQRATAFYALLGVLCSNVWHVGLNQWNLAALVLMAGIGTVSGIKKALGDPPGDPPGVE